MKKGNFGFDALSPGKRISLTMLRDCFHDASDDHWDSGIYDDTDKREQYTFYCFSAESTHLHLIDKYAKMFDVIENTPSLRTRLERDSKLRTAWAGYVARVFFYNTGDLELVPMNEGNKGQIKTLWDVVPSCFLELVGHYDREKELTGNKWVIGLSGNVEVDLKANFIARKAGRMNLKDFMYLMELLHSMCLSVLDSGMESSMDGISGLPRLEIAADAITSMFDELTSVPKKTTNNCWDQEARIFAYGMMEDPGTWLSPLSTPTGFSLADGSRVSAILPNHGITDTDPNAPSYEGRAHLVLRNLLPKRFSLDAVAERGNPGSLTLSEQAKIRHFIEQKCLLSAERTSLGRERDAAKEKRKASAYIEKLERKLERALNELDTLRAQLPKNGKAAEKKAATAAAQTIAQLEQQADTLTKQLNKSQTIAARAEHFEKTAKQAKAERDAMQVRLNKLEQMMKEVDEENKSLQEALLAKMEGAHEESTTETAGLDTSVFDGLNIICFGGFPSFITAMQELHPNIRFYGNVRRPDDTAVAKADALWFQVNNIEHGSYWPLVQSCKRANVPIRYFKAAGHEPCKAQMVAETKRMLDEGLIKRRRK